MNEKTARQIAEMKNQTIGVEVEMNNITRQKAAKVAADFFGTGRFENTAGRNGYSTWSAWDAQGREWKFQKSFADSSDTLAPRAMPPEDAEYTSTSERRVTHRRAFGTSPTSWQATKA